MTPAVPFQKLFKTQLPIPIHIRLAKAILCRLIVQGLPRVLKKRAKEGQYHQLLLETCAVFLGQVAHAIVLLYLAPD